MCRDVRKTIIENEHDVIASTDIDPTETQRERVQVKLLLFLHNWRAYLARKKGYLIWPCSKEAQIHLTSSNILKTSSC
jgi:hypothetical protein